MTAETIRICPSHRERETPLIWTFRFPGAEYWCPHCGELAGAFDGFGIDVPKTDALIHRLENDKAKNEAVLRGQS